MRVPFRPVKRTNVILRDDQHKKLRVEAAKTGTTMGALIRKAVDAYLKLKK